MGTSYYRIPKAKDIKEKHAFLVEKIVNLDIWDIENVSKNFCTLEKGWDRFSVWDEFVDGMKVNLGKASGGWKFLWDFHNNRYYSNKKELLDFIRSGRVIDEYGKLLNTEEFIKMALDWCPDGHDATSYNNKIGNTFDLTPYEKYVDGLRVSTRSDFS